MTFRIRGLPAEDFTHLFGLSDLDLATKGAVRRTADGNYPCRVSLTDSQPTKLAEASAMLCQWEWLALFVGGGGIELLEAPLS